MKRCLLGLSLCLLFVAPVTAQESATVTSDVLTALAELPGVSGYEVQVTSWLAERLARFNPQVDNLGNVTVTLGTGSPHRLLVTSIDEPGYVVSAITPDGYLRVQRLPQFGLHPWFDLLHSAQPVEILTRSGKLVPGVVAGLSTHLQPGRRSPAADPTDHLDRIYIDVGARSADEVRALGVDLLDPLTLEKEAYYLGNSELTSPFVANRFGAIALVTLLEEIGGAGLPGKVTVAFVVRRFMGNQGLHRLLNRIEPDEAIFLQPLQETDRDPGDGVLIAPFADGPATLVAELRDTATRSGIPVRLEQPEAAPTARYMGRLSLPERSASVGVAVKFPQTPAGVVSARDLGEVVNLLARWLQAPLHKQGHGGGFDGGIYRTGRPSVEEILRYLVHAYGVSGYEEPVVERVKEHLPAWAKGWAFEDGVGNLILTFGRPASAMPAGKQAGKPSDKPGLVFVAHSDEIGWAVREIREDGGLALDRRGGFMAEHFLGHAVFIHTAKKRVPAVLELPDDYRTKPYERFRGRQYTAYTGAKSREEAEALGIRVGDSVTVPKRYRKLAGTRVSARSFDDRVGSAALVAALWQLDPETIDREVTFVWAVEEEIGLNGAKHFARRAAERGGAPDFVFAVDTFVSGDSPLEEPRFAQGILGEGFVVRAVDNSNVAPRQYVDRVVAIARRRGIPVQYGVTGGGNDGAAFVPYGSIDIPLGWPLRYSHSAAEVADLKDVEALANIVAALAEEF